MSAGQVLVAGGGIGGLAAAIALSALGHRVTVFEASSEQQGGAFLGVQSNAALALRELGVAEQVLSQGVPVTSYTLWSWRGRPLARWSLAEIAAELGCPNVTVSRQTVLAALWSAVPGDAVVSGARVLSSAEDDTGVAVRLEDGTQVRGDLLIGADGLRSAVRERLLGPEPDTAYAGYGSWRATSATAVTPVSGGTAVHVLGAGRTFGCWPLPGGKTYWVATMLQPPGIRQGLVSPAEFAALRTAFAAAPPLVTALMSATDPATVLYTPIFDRLPTQRWHGDRTVLIGDAAHPMQPTTGQGAAQALLDALALACALRGTDLRSREELRAALTAYTARRQPATAELVREARSIGRMHHTRAAGMLARDLVMRATPGRVWQTRARARLDELDLLSDFRAQAITQGER